MLKRRSLTSADLVCLVAAVAVCFAAGSARAADDQAKPLPSGEHATAPSDNVTRSITIHAPKVAVRANPGAAQARAPQPQAGQYVYFDTQGNRLSSPPANARVTAVPRGQASAPYQNPSFPNALFADTRHITAAISAQVNEKGEITTTCRQHSESPDHECSVHAGTSAVGKAAPQSSTSNKEERE